MNIESMTIGQAREIASLFTQSEGGNPFEIGKSYFFRTVTHHLTGKVVAKAGPFLTLEQAAWVADDGEFSNAMKTGEFIEVEPYQPKQRVFINTESLIDAVEWTHDLPSEVK